MAEEWANMGTEAKRIQMKGVLLQAYADAERMVENDTIFELFQCEVDDKIIKTAMVLGATKHAFRGAALTLLAYKCCDSSQDIRAHKAEHENGFAARSFDTSVTVPFLIEKSLPRSVESHWLTQTLSFAGPLAEDSALKTKPEVAGSSLITVVNYCQSNNADNVTKVLLTALLIQLIKIRNTERVVLTRPKALSIAGVKEILRRHFLAEYKSGAPRLPQIAMYATYMCVIESVARYSGQALEPLHRMKAADRKIGTVGDVVVLNNGNPIEAVEIKFGIPVSYIHIMEAIEKVRAASVSRYYILSTAGIALEEEERILSEIEKFRRQNGCEIIVNGVVETIAYYLRLLPDTSGFLKNYADILEVDEDIDYEHRIAWNKIC